MFGTSQFQVTSPCRDDVATWRYIVVDDFQCRDITILVLQHLVGVDTLL